MKRSLADFLDACTPSDGDVFRFVLYSIEAGKYNQHKIYKLKPSESDVEEDASDLDDGFRLYYQVQSGKTFETLESFQRKKTVSNDAVAEHVSFAGIAIRLIESNEFMLRQVVQSHQALTVAYTDSLARERSTETEYRELKDAVAEALSEANQEESGSLEKTLSSLADIAGKIGIGD